jgi:RNA 3'-terminal phosphate cyclase (ATP)
VLQTVLPALMTAPGPSALALEGGTHNPAAPPFDFLAKTYLPIVARMGPEVHATLDRAGFYPAGGGRMRVQVRPARELGAIALDTRGPIRARRIRAVVANLPRAIAEREIATLARRLAWEAPAFAVETREDSVGPGNLVLAEIESESITDVRVLR